MSRTTKIKAIVLMLLISALMLVSSAFAIGFEKVSPVKAEQQNLFVMSDKIEARMTSPSGLRFRTYLDEATKTAAEEAKEFGFVIAPTINFENAMSTDYLAEGAMVDKAVVTVSARRLIEVSKGDAYYSETENRYFINAVLYNIQEKNWYLDFSAVAYYVTNQNEVVYAESGTLPRANIGALVEQMFFDENGNAETRGQLLESFNYGGLESKTVNVEEVGEYIVPAHPIPVNNDNVVAVVTNADNAYSFKLTESVEVNNQNINEGRKNIIPNFDQLLMTKFDGVLDGNGYDFVISIHTNNRPTRGVFVKDLNGTIKNLNLIVRAETWSSGNSENGSVIYNLNGTIENCVITAHTERYGSTNWTLKWAMIENATENAVIKNSVFNNKADMYDKFIRAQSEGTTIENVAIVNDKAIDTDTIGRIPVVGNIDGLYLYNSPTSLIAGTPAYKFDGSAIVATSDKFNVDLDLGLVDVKVRGGQNGQNADGAFTDVEETHNVPVMLTKETELRAFTKVDNAADLYSALRAQKKIVLTSDITINNANSSASDKVSAVVGHVVDQLDYVGILDGNGYTLTINIGGTTRSNGILFSTLSGTVRNINVLISFEGWGSGNTEHYGSFIGALKGTVENCSVTMINRRFGNATLTYSPIHSAGPNAVVKNSVFYSLGPINTGKLIANYFEADGKTVATNPTATIENVAIIDNGWTTAELATVKPTVNTSGLYLFDGIENAANGKVAYKYDGNAIVESNEVIDFRSTFGYRIAAENRNVLYVAYNGGKYGADVVETYIVPIMYAVADTNVNVELSTTKLTLNEKSEPTQLTATITIGGNVVDKAVAIWSSSDENVVKVVGGLVTVVGKGTATITAIYYGITATCEVTVEEYWYEIGTAEQFVSVVKSDLYARIKLTADITINNKSVNGGFSTVDKCVVDKFYGDIDGQGNTITLVMLESGRNPVNGGFLFNTFSGKIENTSFIVSAYYWGDGTKRYPGLIGSLDGSMENCIINIYSSRFGSAGNILWTAINNTTANAVVKNVVIYDASGDMGYNFTLTTDANTVIENLMLVDANGWTDTFVSRVLLSNNTKNVYLFASVANFANGSYAYTYNGSAIVAEAGKVNVSRLLGFTVTTGTITAYRGSSGAGTPSGYAATATTTTAPIFIDDAEYVVVTTGAELYSAINSNLSAKIRLGADIVLNNKNISENATNMGATILSTDYTFSGIIDGQGYTLTVNANDTGRPTGVLFGRFAGIMKNLNVVIRTNNWGSGNESKLGSFIGFLSGTVENCVVTMYHTRFGTAYNLRWAVFGKLEDTAYVKDCVFYQAKDMVNNFVHEVSANAVVENVAIVDKTAWTETSRSAILLDGYVIDGLYLFDSLDDLVAGKVAYEFNGYLIVSTDKVVDFGITKFSATVRAGTYSGGVYTDVEQVIDAIKR